MRAPTAAVELSDVTFRYPGAEADSLRGVDLRIERGDFVAVVGSNGSGKTTLCKTFNGLIPRFWQGDFGGRVKLFGWDTADHPVAALSKLVGYVYQDFGNQLVRPTVRDDVSFAPINFGLEDWAARTDEALDALGIRSIADRHIWQLSGGQQHLTALAGSLAMTPGLLVVDEPVAEVDPQAAHDLYERLAHLNAELGVTVVVIEHHAEFVARYAKSVVLMSDGGIRWHLPVREALGRTRDLEDAHIPAPQVTAVVRAFDDTTEVPLTVGETATWIRERGLVPHDLDASAAVGPEAASEATPGAVIARLSAVDASYRTVEGPRHPVLHALDLEIHDGERVAIVGANGAGKSTLLSLLAGLTVPREGTVEIAGIDTRTVSAAQLADQVALLGQRPEEMFLTDSIRGDIEMHPLGRRLPDAAELVEEVIERFALGAIADRDGRLVSGGQQRRAALAIGLAMRPALLLLDEPTSSLDVASRDEVIALLATMSDRIRSVVVVTHDMHLVAEWANRVVVLDAGRIVADLAPAVLFDRPEVLRAARLVPPQVTELGLELGLHPVPLSVGELVARLQRVGAGT